MDSSNELMFRQVVLAVDDNSDWLAFLDTLLTCKGYVVLKTASAALALHLIKSFMPNLLLIDVLIPDMNGFELCERVRQIPHTANVPIIILTALNSLKSKQQAIEAGANAFITKTNMSSDLASEIQRLLSNGAIHLAVDTNHGR